MCIRDRNYYNSEEWQYGWEKVVPIVKEEGENYKKIIVSDKQPLDKSYMFFAFYLKYPPDKYQIFAKDQSGGFAEKHYFDKYEFRPIDWDKDSKEENVLFVGKPEEFPAQGKNMSIISTIKYLNGKEAILI